MKTIRPFQTMLTVMLLAPQVNCWADETGSLEERIHALEDRISALEESLAPVIEKARREQLLESQQLQARERMRRDADHYSRNELREIEKLYQVANKKWRSAEAKQSLQQLVEKYDKANRTGCAILYLGQMTEGKEKVAHLQQAIDQFGDCYYGDGVQVGAYSRYLLGGYYLHNNHPQKAAKLFEELRESFPNAIDHRGKSLLGELPKE